MPSSRSGSPVFQARAQIPLLRSGSLASFQPRGILVLRGGDSAEDEADADAVIAEPPTEEQAAAIREGLERILLRLMHPDSDTIRGAEEEFDAICSDPTAAEQLAAIALDPAAPEQLRQLAAILLRQRVTDLWIRMSVERQDALQDGLISGVTGVGVTAPSKALRGELARLVGLTATLSPTMFKLQGVVKRAVAAAAPGEEGGETQKDVRVAALELLGMLEETVGEELEAQRDSIDKVCEPALASTHPEIQRAAVKLAVSAAVRAHAREGVSEAGPTLLEPLYNVLARAVHDGDQEGAGTVLEGITDIVAMGWHAVDEKRVAPLVGIALEALSAARALSLRNRERAALLLAELATCRPDLLTDHHLVPKIVDALLSVMQEKEEEGAAAEAGEDFGWQPPQNQRRGSRTLKNTLNSMVAWDAGDGAPTGADLPTDERGEEG
ncbi:armadillo-type protein, partial [Baffinella frigidus]